MNWSPSGKAELPSTHLHSHDQTTGYVPHLVHDAVRSSPELADLLQVISLHLEILFTDERRMQSMSEMKGAVMTEAGREEWNCGNRFVDWCTATLQNMDKKTASFTDATLQLFFYIIQAKKVFHFDFEPTCAENSRHLCQWKIPLIWWVQNKYFYCLMGNKKHSSLPTIRSVQFDCNVHWRVLYS